ncbi:hypothetical protein ONS95_007413 [Cadophora gregata]|uniref:uncharacterized protein n=1 Tax=Cadophora gregata TaxID=51156 RepID=UPI0026DD7C93|nr:uncharacterized protein ONS95_007413 [Cadophora gregata]KAK0118523.1 hypothetical protein ONS96_011619 [Cadophora gregata f. sp. sojae]KAK0125781.1 hypothetical protein ONS95_007413 [Cadophora gregata]
MRPALQTLVASPSSRELLRFLVGNEGAAKCFAPANLESRRGKKRNLCLRKYSGLAIAARESQGIEFQAKEIDGTGDTDQERLHPHVAVRPGGVVNKQKEPDFISTAPNALLGTTSRQEESLSRDGALSHIQAELSKYMEPNGRIHWRESMFSHERLEYESDISVLPDRDRKRLLDTRYKTDIELWAMLLEYRQRIHGSAGVLNFWRAIQERAIQLPTKGYRADSLWYAFLSLGLKDPDVLDEIYQYSKESGLHPSVYPCIVGHFLEAHQGDAALTWHNRLSAIQKPNQITFRNMCRRVIIREGDLGKLKQLYNMLPYRDLYHKIIPLLCQSQKYKLAMQWHSFLCNNGDFPPSAKHAETLVHYLANYDPPSARRVTQDLVKGGVSFASTLSQKLEDSFKISRELMNVIHGETLHIPVKKYNDELGARWFATTWISLDVAINAVHALGIQEIGPLSLQAIALRDPEPKAILARIEQLKELGISIGTSLFSRAVKTFARHASHGKLDVLDGLLNSDQHPDELENFKLQEALLEKYAHEGDWTQYRRTLEIRLLASFSPHIDRRNIELRMITSTSEPAAALRGLEDMLLDGIPVKGQTISLLLRHILPPRQSGHRPMTLRNRDGGNGKPDLMESIAMLKAIMRSGTYVPPKAWHEVFRRLGMLGQMGNLRRLCIWLATHYGPQNHTLTESWLRRYRVPAELSTSHGLHPVRMLFPASLQKAIIEWGFIASRPQLLRRTHSSRLLTTSTSLAQASSAITSGIYILKKLNSLGVHIERRSVRKAIFHRLIMYYGPGYSNRRYNEHHRGTIVSLEEAAKQIDEALGGEYFTAVELQKIIQRLAAVKWRRRERASKRKGLLQSRDPRSRLLLGSGRVDEDQDLL